MNDRTMRRARLQIDLVLVVYRAERDRARRRGGNPEVEHRIRARSLEILDGLRTRIAGDPASDPDVLAELAAARDAVASEA